MQLEVKNQNCGSQVFFLCTRVIGDKPDVEDVMIVCIDELF